MFRLSDVSWIFAFTVFFLAVSSAPEVHAQQLTLKLRDGDFSVTGELLSFDGKFYLIKSEKLGRMKVSIEKFDCLGVNCPVEVTGSIRIASGPSLRIAGSPSIGEHLMPLLISDYAASIGASADQVVAVNRDAYFDITGMDNHGVVSVHLINQGSDAGFSSMLSGETDIVMADRPISPEEIRRFEQAGLPRMNRPGHEHVVALDAVVIFISPANPVDMLATQDVARIFAGEITDWSEVGGTPGKITVYAADESLEASNTFRSVLMKRFKKTLTPRAKRFRQYAALAKTVAEDPGGIGYARFAQMAVAKPLALSEPCGLILRPSKFSVKSSEYPLSRKLYLYTANTANKHAANFIEYALSKAAESAVAEAGLIDAEPATVHFRHCRDRVMASLNAAPEDFNMDLLRELMRTLGSAYRLSSTMLFELGSAQLDSESIQSLPAMVDRLRKGKLAGQRPILVGYSDNGGQFEANRQLALKRATAVLNALTVMTDGDFTAQDIQVEAYGELFPVACNGTGSGREKNRRVELWFVGEDGAGAKALHTQKP